MYYSNCLEYVVMHSYSNPGYFLVNYFSKNIDGDYYINGKNRPQIKPNYSLAIDKSQYSFDAINFSPSQSAYHSFTPEIFLAPLRPNTRIIDDDLEALSIAKEIFELMMHEKLPENILITILPFVDFRQQHSQFGTWNDGILGFSINGDIKRIFIRKTNLDLMMIVLGHEIGHVLSDSLKNKHDEEAKAFAFSIEWAKTIKKHDIAGLASKIKDDIDFQPAKNGLHDVAFDFVNFMVHNGRKAMELHNDLAKQYMSIFDRIY